MMLGHLPTLEKSLTIPYGELERRMHAAGLVRVEELRAPSLEEALGCTDTGVLFDALARSTLNTFQAEIDRSTSELERMPHKAMASVNIDLMGMVANAVRDVYGAGMTAETRLLPDEDLLALDAQRSLVLIAAVSAALTVLIGAWEGKSERPVSKTLH